MERQNVPAFEAEPDMPPETNYKGSVRFYYVRHDIGNTDKYWQELGKYLNDDVERDIGSREEIKAAALEAIGNETVPEEKLRKLYDRAQQIRNLSYERSRSDQEKKKENIKSNQNIVDVLKRGYGNNLDITELFVGMARAAGFHASLLLVSNREEEFFSSDVLSLDSLPNRMALVTLNGKDIYLQPAVRYCPFGLLYWSNTSTDALRFDKTGGKFFTLPALTFDQAVTRRVANVELSDDGTLKGHLTVEFRGEEALQHRVDERDSDDAGKKKDFEDEVKAWLPKDAVVKLETADGWNSTYAALTGSFSVEIPGYATKASKRLLISPLLFQRRENDAFKHAERKYPVYFPYPFSEFDRVEIKLPAGYSPESIPTKQGLKLDYARYQSASVTDGKYLVSERALEFNAFFIPIAQYPSVKDFMSKMQANEEQPAVMKIAAATDAQLQK